MLKFIPNEGQLTADLSKALRELLKGIPSIEVGPATREPRLGPHQPDLLIDFIAFGKAQTLAIEVKKNAQPRFARMAILQLRDFIRTLDKPAKPILASSYLSPEVRNICKQEDVGYIDLEGNTRIALDNIFIERTVPTRPAVDKRHLKSLFRPKSAQILRVLLRAPWIAWKVKDLALAADVSLGQVSNIRMALLEREWAIETPEGVILTEPNMLLDAWRNDYIRPTGQRVAFYTHRSAKEIESTSFYVEAPNETQHLARAAFSAAAWLAPYGRVQTHYFYADFKGYDQLKERFDLSQVDRGENVVVTVLSDLGPLRDSVEAAPGILCTSPVQTYLDLYAMGERGREAAEHLREAKLQWLK